MKSLLLKLAMAATSAALLQPAAGQGSKADYERALSAGKRFDNKVFRDRVEPNWLPDGNRFWYRVETGPGKHELVLVDAAAGTRTVVADPSALPAAPALKSSELPLQTGRTRRTGAACQLTIVNRMSEPVEAFWVDTENNAKAYGKIAPGAEATQSTFAGHQWVIKDLSGQPLAALQAQPGIQRLEMDGPSPPSSGREEARGDRGAPRGPVSPDKKHRIVLRNHNLFLKMDGVEEVPLTTDGTAEQAYREEVAWSPDSTALVATRVVPGQEHPVHLVDSTPDDQLQPKLFTHDYLKPGDKLPKPRPVLIHLADRKAVLIDDALFSHFFTQEGSIGYRWQPDSRSFTFSYNQRGHQVFRLISVDRDTAAARALVEEKTDTFIDYTQKTWHRFLDDTKELIWMSERDGWCHLYLIDVTSGQVKNHITKGQWVVRKVESVDEKARRIWFHASGQRDGEDPYHEHLCRINFDGTEALRLTEGDGNHRVVFSPDRLWLVDTWSRPDQPPVTELRRASDGKLVLTLERGDASALVAAGWQVPERFSAKGRDGQTDIHGLIYKPSNFDSTKSYPVVENIYAGPHDSFVSKDFEVMAGAKRPLAELGFIVVQIDGMGTDNRGKKFHAVAWKNIADAGFPDRIAWLKAAAATRPWMDLARMGIYGGSAGGQNAMRALIDHGDFYQAAVADCGCHDNRMDKIWWNEQWMGWPVDESYVKSSNKEDSHKLQGHLLLIVGELDTNVDPASTTQVVAALQKAGKSFDFMPIAGTGHGAAETPYGSRLRAEFLVRHLKAD